MANQNIILIAVRLKSTRLKNKTLLPLYKKPLLTVLIDRLKKSKLSSKIIVCTSTNFQDDKIAKLSSNMNIEFFRGSEKDILQRFLDAAATFGTDYIINVDGDDIFTDPKTVDSIVENYSKSKTDFIKITNVPLGLQSFGFTLKFLKQICKNKKTNDTETGWIRFFTESEIISKDEALQNLTTPFPEKIRLSLDYPEDFEVAKNIFSSLGENFDLEELSEFLNKNQEILSIIQKTEKKWKNHWNTNLSDTSMKKNEEL